MLDFSQTDDANTSGNSILPEGEYLAVATRAELDNYKGKDQVKVTFTVQEGDHEGRLIFEDLYLTPSALWRVKQLLAANGALAPDFKGSLSEDELPSMILDRDVIVRVKHETYNEKTKAKVDRYIAPAKAPF